jgi:glutathione synthase/RimK-type ligase-like ATP-grasp enzyme
VSLLKPFQLQRLERWGFPVPRTLVTNDPDRARDFVAGVGRAIAKPVLGGAFAQEMAPEAVARLELIRQSPVMFQELVAGPDIRVTAAGGRILSAVEVESDRLDFRATEAYERGEEQLTPVDLPAWVHEMCRRAMEASGLGFTALDLKRRGPDDYVILELNFSPAFLWVERKTGHPISEGLARYLVYCAEHAARAGTMRSGPETDPAVPMEAEGMMNGAGGASGEPDGGAGPDGGRGSAGDGRRQGLKTFFDYGLPRPSAVADHFGG